MTPEIPPVNPALADALVADIIATGERRQRESSEHFQHLLQRLAGRLPADPQAASQALGEGSFLIDDCLVVMRLNPDNDCVEFFCDIGLADPHHASDAMRTLLKWNLNRSVPGITFGLHPESERMVATTSTHAMLLADEDACLQMMGWLASEIRQLRKGHELRLQ